MKDPFARLNELISKHFPQGLSNVINMHIGDPKGPANPRVVEFLRENLDLAHYPPQATIPELKEAIIFYNKAVHNVSLNPNQLAAVQGTKSALAWIPSAFMKKGRISVPDLSYSTYIVPAQRFNPSFCFYQLAGQITPPRDIDYLIINSPHNPTGSIMSRNQLEMLVESAQKDDFILISDECYIDIYRGEKPASLLELDKTGFFKNLLVLNSLSKSSNLAGLRSGFIAGDSALIKRFQEVYSTTGNTISIPAQKASAIAWQDTDFISQNRLAYNSAISDFSQKTGLSIPEGAFYFFPSTGQDCEHWTIEMLKRHKIKVMPGKYLDYSNSGIYDQHIRIPVAENMPSNITDAFKDMLTR